MDNQFDVALLADLQEQHVKPLTTNDSNVVGRVFHESLLRSLLRKSQPAGQAFGVTNGRVMTATLNFEEHAARCNAAREAGRFFSQEAVANDEELLFIGATSVGVNHGDNSEVALTFIQDLQPMHLVTSEDAFVPAFKESKIRMFLDQLSESGAISVVNDGDICLTKDEYDALPAEEREGFTTASNALLMEMFIGSTYSFKFCRAKAEAEAAG